MKNRDHFFRIGSPERREYGLLVIQGIVLQANLTTGVLLDVWRARHDLIANIVIAHIICTLLSVGLLIWRLRRINRMLSAFDASYANSTSAQVPEPRNDG